MGSPSLSTKFLLSCTQTSSSTATALNGSGKNQAVILSSCLQYQTVLSPDFSIYLKMAPVMQLYSVSRNRWCGAYRAFKGIQTIPIVNWGDEASFTFCFDEIAAGSAVAMSTYMASFHNIWQDQKNWLMTGDNEMLRWIEPEKIICYNTPFPEMRGGIVHVDYDRSSRRYMHDERSYKAEDFSAFKIGGPPEIFHDTLPHSSMYR